MKRVLGFVIVLGCLLYLLLPRMGSGALRVHMLSGSEEYRSEESLAGWAEHLKQEYGIATTFSLGTDKSTEVDGLENLKQADVLVVFCRRWELSAAQVKLVVDAIQQGKPVLGIRTASHAFEFFKSFDRDVLGGDYTGHWQGDEPVGIVVSQRPDEHPILRDVTGWQRLGKLYKNRTIADDAQLLLHTEREGERVPLAWARTLNNRQRVFYTSLGIPGDFQNESFIRLLDSALFWVADVKPQASTEDDWVRHLQETAFQQQQADWGYWGSQPAKYSTWTNHSNRLVPVYAFGMKLDGISGENSIYRDETRLAARYGFLPTATLNPNAEYFDQTQLFDLQQQAVRAGKRFIFLVVFDGMDWQTTLAAAVVRGQKVGYESGRGTGLQFQEYRAPINDYGFMVTSAHNGGTEFDVDAQRVLNPGGNRKGGYSAKLGGGQPWSRQVVGEYLQGTYRAADHVLPASAASATSMTAGIKTYLGSINVDFEGRPVEPIARSLQREHGFSVGVVTSVPISHATPAAAYANNVTRNDFQDLTRDLLGLPSIAHRAQPLPGVDVLIGGGWNETVLQQSEQGQNFVPGNQFLTARDRKTIDVAQGGMYRTVERTAGARGAEALLTAARTAASNNERLLGLFGVAGGHLPYQTADGNYNPTRGVNEADSYDSSDIEENPTLAVMTQAALCVLETNERGFWMMVEPGDVDWANHDNNIDNSIGAVLSGDEAFVVITDWIDRNNAWDQSVVIVTADHGHMFHLVEPEALIQPSREATSE